MNLDRLLRHEFEPVEHTFGPADAMHYALAVGLGHDPVDPGQLRFVYEDGLRGFPTFPLVLAYPGFWIARPEFGVDWKAVLHGEQSIELHRPVPVSGTVVGRLRVVDVVDKGAAGAFVYSERTVEDAATGELVATMCSTTICRNDGGHGGTAQAARRRRATPDRAPDAVVELPTLPQSALLYRLTGDRNPLHADPAVAREAGFERPILHGLCTFGVAAHALLKAVAGYDPDALSYVEARFSAPVLPGDTLATRIWRDGDGVSFDVARDGTPVLTHGWARLG